MHAHGDRKEKSETERRRARVCVRRRAGWRAGGRRARGKTKERAAAPAWKKGRGRVCGVEHAGEAGVRPFALWCVCVCVCVCGCSCCCVCLCPSISVSLREGRRFGRKRWKDRKGGRRSRATDPFTRSSFFLFLFYPSISPQKTPPCRTPPSIWARWTPPQPCFRPP